jgi:molybdopterin-containing oxidoreductase family iron-sulfur binding subunit
MAIDLDQCTGCGACVTACKQENNQPPGTAEMVRQGRLTTWAQIITEVEGSYPDLHARQYPLMCLQCDNPPCVKVCPVEATYLDDEGIVAQIYPRCIGCRYCTNACPYSAKVFNWFEPAWPEGTEARFNPDVSVRNRGLVEKCTFCHHRLMAAREEARIEGKGPEGVQYEPACVEVCPARAMVFGDLDDPHSEVSRAHANPRAFRLAEELGTEPKVVYLQRSAGEPQP